ncbi:MAG TPA: vWA domain-containing protein, partial [Nitrosospira sp.]
MDRTAIQQIRTALKDVVSNPVLPLNTALWVFDSEVIKLHGFSRNGRDLAAAIDEIGAQPRQGDKAKLYEAIALTLSELRNYRTEGSERLILVTAGKDGGSSITEQVVINEANAQNIEIDVVAFGNISDAGSELLARLAKSTAGHFIFAGNASQLAYELRKLLDLTSLQVVNVIFQYQAPEELYRVNSARLEFAPGDQTPVSLPIGRGLAAPWAAPFGGGLSDHPASKQEVGRMIFQWITVGATGYIGYLAVYLLRRKRTKPVPKDRSAPGNDKDSKGS